jgi:DNA-binding response OmpR family regulator
VEGFKLLRQLKSSPATAHIPLIGTIRNDSPGLRERCIEHGALDYLRQPIEADAFYSAVQAAIEKNPRSCIRLRTVLPVKVHGNAGDSLYGAYTLAISADGMFLRTTSPLSLNSRISLELNVSGRAIAAETEVVYSCQTGACEEPGVGLRFIDISRSDRALIRQFIQREVMKGITGGNS